MRRWLYGRVGRPHQPTVRCGVDDFAPERSGCLCGHREHLRSMERQDHGHHELNRTGLPVLPGHRRTGPVELFQALGGPVPTVVAGDLFSRAAMLCRLRGVGNSRARFGRRRSRAGSDRAGRGLRFKTSAVAEPDVVPGSLRRMSVQPEPSRA